MYAVWRYSEGLAEYEQQDAHEFFISMVNGIHQHCDGTNENCNCIIHRIFTGKLRSDLNCSECEHTSTATDPFFDISIDLPRGKDGLSSEVSSEITPIDNSLFACLRQ